MIIEIVKFLIETSRTKQERQKYLSNLNEWQQDYIDNVE